MVYQLIAHVLKICVRVFYRVRSSGDETHDQGPTLIVANHPNGLLDPLVILTRVQRPIRFLAKEPLFRMPVIGWLLRTARALPVYRKQDGYSGAENASMFSAIESALQTDTCVCLFPEGISHNEPHLQPLKTGAARIALAAEAQGDFKLNIRIVPIGLHFVDKGTFRSEVVSSVGEPIILGEAWREAYETDAFSAARALTSDIDASIQAVTVNLESWSDLPLISFINQLYQSEDLEALDPVERLSVIAEAHDSFNRVSPNEVTLLRTRILRFKRVLDKLGVTPESLDQKPSTLSMFWFALGQLTALIIGLPFALMGTLLFFIPYQAVELLVKMKSPERDIVATVKLLSGILFYLMWYCVVVGLVFWGTGWIWGIATLALMPLLGLHTLLFIERRSGALRRTLITLRSLLLSSPKKLLIRERDDLCELLDEIASRDRVS